MRNKTKGLQDRKETSYWRGLALLLAGLTLGIITGYILATHQILAMMHKVLAERSLGELIAIMRGLT